MSVGATTTASASNVERWLRPLRRLYARPSSAIGSTIFAVFLVFALFGPLIAPFSATEQIIADRSQPPSLDHLLGTDRLGRDIFSRVVLGARDIFLLAGLGTAVVVFSGPLRVFWPPTLEVGLRR